MNAGRVKWPEGIFWKSPKSRRALPHFVRTLRQSKPFMLLPCTCIAIMTRRIFRKRSHKSSRPLDEAENRLKVLVARDLQIGESGAETVGPGRQSSEGFLYYVVCSSGSRSSFENATLH